MNRFNNIIPYTHSTVNLPIENGEDQLIGSYINASWV